MTKSLYFVKNVLNNLKCQLVNNILHALLCSSLISSAHMYSPLQYLLWATFCLTCPTSH